MRGVYDVIGLRMCLVAEISYAETACVGSLIVVDICVYSMMNNKLHFLCLPFESDRAPTLPQLEDDVQRYPRHCGQDP